MRIRHIIYLLVAGCLLASGCSKEEGIPSSNTLVRNANAETVYPEAGEHGNPCDEYDAIVTVKETEEHDIYFQVDSLTRVYPINYEEPYDGPKRLACRLIEFLYDPVEGNKYFHLGYVEWFEELAKGTVETEEEGFRADDGIDLLEDWMTSLEDAFLTLHYSTSWGDGSIVHSLFLEQTGDAEFRLLHYRNGDQGLREADSLIYFDLNDCLPKTDGMDITLKWTTGAGESAEKSFRFRSRP